MNMKTTDDILYEIEVIIRENLEAEETLIKYDIASLRDLGYWSGLSKALAIVISFHHTGDNML